MWFLLLGCLYRELSAPNSPGDSATDPTVNIADPTLEDLTVTNCAAAPSTLRLTFSTPNPTIAVVEFGPTSAYGWSSVPTPTAQTSHHIQVPGFPPGEDWHWRVRVDGVDGVYETLDQSFTGTAFPPGEIPTFDIGIREEGAFQSGFRIAPSLGVGGVNFITIVNDDGSPIWWTVFESPFAATQAYMTADGSGISYLLADYTRDTDIGKIVRQDWCGETLLEARAEWGHHDFLVRPDGGYTFVAADIRDHEGTPVVGDAVVEMDADGGNATAIWSTWDHLAVTVPPGCTPAFYPQGCDWTHGNGIAYQASEDAYFYSSHAVSAIARLERNGGVDRGATTTWIVSPVAPPATIGFADDATAWKNQHGFKPVGDDEYILFDNGPGDVSTPSEVRRVRIDPAGGDVTTVWNSEYDGQHTSLLLGDVQLLPNGNYYVGWGSEAEITELRADDEAVLWQANFELGVALAFTNLVTNIGGEVP